MTRRPVFLNTPPAALIQKKEEVQPVWSAARIELAFPEEKFRSEFLIAADGGAPAGTRFFSSLDYANDAREGRASDALHKGLHLLASCRNIDSGAYERIHKGDIFYWIGTAAFHVHDYETAAFFYDAAVSEDLRTSSDGSVPPTPAAKFILVEPAHAAEPLVEALRDEIGSAIERYSQLSNAREGLTLEMIRTSFLRPAISSGFEAWRSLATAFHSFLMESQYRKELLTLRPGPGTSEPFFLHLFKGGVLFESLLKENRKIATSGPTLRQILPQLFKALSLPEAPRTGARNLSALLSDLENGGASILSTIATAGKARNLFGHNLGWRDQITQEQYDRLVTAITLSCLHAIACLYVDVSV